MLAFLYLPILIVAVVAIAHGVVAVLLHRENRRNALPAVPATPAVNRRSFQPRVIAGGGAAADAPRTAPRPMLYLVGADD
ncbi:hypothetical protein [Acidiphilium acidophilum]|uniref:Uncharacterized protein n=1 Tax=Acidiphilium acidophilum TaxID=76588 RepID=A0AAW9DM45_ACIAO|nr:hypothetical protein [Acidiphilium acidophilum]MDX5930070.1 hypothetical protein [Acidiphilium acidophilum]